MVHFNNFQRSSKKLCTQAWRVSNIFHSETIDEKGRLTNSKIRVANTGWLTYILFAQTFGAYQVRVFEVMSPLFVNTGSRKTYSRDIPHVAYLLVKHL